ncbi:MAG: protein-methionine-sulfoxide reductase catalytic subunit MsrP [Pseudomonadota bacterium]|nr:protein-methionine-sulfoxide reductase catalytic subunit MsrP [Pseudomonadota bacterium]|tara:strand:+ start:1749 stop:2723 length:975 start_codon:yes stop_codon:yes gene_type:complete
MLIRSKPNWVLPESAATDETYFLNRRELCKSIAAGSILAAVTPIVGASPAFAAKSDDPSAGLYPANRNDAYTLDRDITPEKITTTYNNFYEFGSHKNIWRAAQKLNTRPWEVTIDGMVEKEQKVDIDTLLKAMPLEERLYRHRCVEAWAIAVPWTGFPMKALIDFAKPSGGAKYVVMETFHDKKTAPGQRQFWYPWPYLEAITIEEAANELSMIGTGAYGKPMPKQNGAPLRLVVPWKYGFKQIKSVVRFHFTANRPKSFWEQIQPREYGFWANVNPEVDHPRWSQATERLLGTGKRVPTLLYNGYAEQVAGLYANMKGQRIFY